MSKKIPEFENRVLEIHTSCPNEPTRSQYIGRDIASVEDRTEAGLLVLVPRPCNCPEQLKIFLEKNSEYLDKAIHAIKQLFPNLQDVDKQPILQCVQKLTELKKGLVGTMSMGLQRISKSKSLGVFTYEKNASQEMTTKRLFDQIRNTHNLRVLNLQGCTLADNNLLLNLAEALKSFDEKTHTMCNKVLEDLETLDLRDTPSGEEGIMAIITAAPELKEINITTAQVGPEAIQRIANIGIRVSHP